MYEWYVNNMRIVNNATNYGKNMSLSSTVNGIIVQESFYKQMEETFFTYLCDKNLEPTYATGFVYQCFCSGFGFGGMPALYLDTNPNSTNVFESGRSQSYNMNPQDYLYYPKVNQFSRATQCQLAMDTLGALDSSEAGTTESEQTLILGKVFIRKYKMGMTFDDTTSIVTISVVSPSSNAGFVTDLVLNLAFLILLSIFVVWMTKKRLHRYNYEHDMFKKLKILAEEDPKITM
jgi:hypothetical protein